MFKYNQSNAKTGFILSIFLLCGFLLPLQTSAQNQSIRGLVSDKLSQLPLSGVLVEIPYLQKSTTTDSFGHFVLQNLPPDRYDIQMSAHGYKPLYLPNVVLTSGKEIVLEVVLEDEFKQFKSVHVKATQSGNTINKLVSVSSRNFTIDEVNRYAGGRSDPARLVANFAGVTTPDDSRNDIVIRGNSPVGVLWRIDGLNVTNPNHFASVGTTGGAVSALNTNLLKNSDFLTSAFPAEFGNATAGIFDLGFRNGNNKKRETTLQMGVISGLEATTEGPFSKKSESSYLVGYRYALAGVAQKVGVNIGTTATPSYQDLSFKMNSAATNFGKFSVFGVWATSTINIGGGNQNSLYGNGNQVDFSSKIGILGVNHFKQINKRSYLTSVIGMNYFSNNQSAFAFDRQSNLDFVKEINNVSKNTYVIGSTYHLKVNSRLFLKIGAQDELLSLKLDYKNKDRILDDFTQIWDYTGSTHLTQIFTHLKYSVTEKLVLNAGLHEQSLALNHSQVIEPRLGLCYHVSPKSSLNFGYGLHAQMQPINVYFLQSKDSNGNLTYNNKSLDFTKSRHFVLGYTIQPFKHWRIKTELYYQSIFNVPVTAFSSTYSMLNTGATFKADLQDQLVNNGSGHNQGLECTIEKFFYKGYYGLISSSVYSSKYIGSDGIERNTAFNGRYVFNVLTGKEWKIGVNKRNKVSMDFKFTNAGGRAYTPIDLDASNTIGHEQLSNDFYSAYYDSYYRMDLKFGFTLNSSKRKLAHAFSLDMQNITNRKNVFSVQYDERQRAISTTYQLGFFPNLMYKLQF